MPILLGDGSIGRLPLRPPPRESTMRTPGSDSLTAYLGRAAVTRAEDPSPEPSHEEMGERCAASAGRGQQCSRLAGTGQTLCAGHAAMAPADAPAPARRRSRASA